MEWRDHCQITQQISLHRVPVVQPSVKMCWELCGVILHSLKCAWGGWLSARGVADTYLMLEIKTVVTDWRDQCQITQQISLHQVPVVQPRVKMCWELCGVILYSLNCARGGWLRARGIADNYLMLEIKTVIVFLHWPCWLQLLFLGGGEKEKMDICTHTLLSVDVWVRVCACTVHNIWTVFWSFHRPTSILCLLFVIVNCFSKNK